jgi:Ethanolamine utilization protein EutJ (predicted chaperonin)
VPVELALLLLGEPAVGIDARSVLDLGLLHRYLEIVALARRVTDRHERRLGAEEAGVDQRPLGLVALRIEVDLVDRPDLVSVAVDEVRTAPVAHLLLCRHRDASFPPPCAGLFSV